ncbi:MAG: Spy/CpxP family protein refolding chaperone [Mariprofundaceae bacterium]|nr:Spy/CpxP family protein refolding chaperone [Mariprofundaceae bacterium]
MNNSTKAVVVTAMMMAFPVSGLACDINGPASKASPPGSQQAGDKQHVRHGHHSIPGKNPNYIRKILKGADRIGLSDRQRQQIGDLLVQAEVDAARAHAEAETTVAAFRSRMHSGKLSDKEVAAYTRRMGELRAARLSANLKASVAASRLLSDEQKARLHAGRSHRGAKT